MKGQKLNMKEIFQEVPDTRDDNTPAIKKRGAKRNKTAGHLYEYAVRDEHRKIGYPHVITCIGESKNRDAQKIDLMNKDEHINGRFPYNVQCKCTSELVDYVKIFNGHKKMTFIKRTGEKTLIDVDPMPTIPGIVNVIFHKKTRKVMHKSKDGSLKEVFIAQGEFVITKKDDWLTMVAELKRLKETYEP